MSAGKVYRRRQTPPEPKIHATLYTVVRDPADPTGDFVVRRHFLVTGGPLQTEFSDFLRADTAEAVRAKLHRRVPGLTMLARDPDDSPNILETWC
jgi:hypothetical protein